MDLKGKIGLSEERYKRKLEKFFNDIFKLKGLSSHGLDHHRRVWYFSKELLGLMDFLVPEEYENRFTEKLLFASYLHDSGMSIDPGPKHGIHSKIFCTEFLRQNKLDPDEYADLLEAIENHDDKDYLNKTEQPVLLKYLSVADDLDAFGFLGIYRYLEIYLKRMTNFQDLGDIILKNAAGRFGHLSETFRNYPLFVADHLKRYEILKSFFINYNAHCQDYGFGTVLPSGYCGVAEIIGFSIKSEKSIGGLISAARTYKDETVSWYFDELTKEVEYFETVTLS